MRTNIRNQRGFTLIELVVVMVILALLAAVAVPKFMDLQKQAEAASVKKVIGNLRSALSIRVAQGLVNSEDLAPLAYNGPAPHTSRLVVMQDLLSNKPESYIGEHNNSTQRGAWFDDSNTRHELVYVTKNAGIVSINGADNTSGQQVRYRIERIFDGNNVLTGLELAAVDTLIWQY